MPPEPPQRVTVVNDNLEFLKLMGDLLHEERYVVTLVDGDRDDAVDLIQASRPQALIIDLRLGRAELHGWEVLRTLRADPELSELPTLICTGDLRGLEQVADQLAGMRRVSTLKKPFDIDELFSKLDALLEREPA
jgi:two-component system chemotaxis response regulator CheY